MPKDCPFLRSVPLTIELEGLGTLEVRSDPVLEFNDKLPAEARDLGFFMPMAVLREPGTITLSHLIIPGPRAPHALRRVLDGFVAALNPKLGKETQIAFVMEAERQVISANLAFYERLRDRVQTVMAAGASEHIHTMAAEFAAVQMESSNAALGMTVGMDQRPVRVREAAAFGVDRFSRPYWLAMEPRRSRRERGVWARGNRHGAKDAKLLKDPSFAAVTSPPDSPASDAPTAATNASSHSPARVATSAPPATNAASAPPASHAIEGVDGVVDLKVEQLVLVPHIQIRIRPEAAAIHGLTPGTIRSTANAYIQGAHAGQLYQDQKVFDVVVTGEAPNRTDPNALRELLIATPGGAPVPLGDVADVQILSTPNLIKHEGSSRRIDVTCNVAGDDLGSVARQIEENVKKLSFERGYHPEFLGEYAARQSS